jgi:hypothetical protein
MYGQSFATSTNGGGEGANNTTALNGYWGQDAANAALDAQDKKSQFGSYDLSGNHKMDFMNDPKDGLTFQQWALMMGAALAGGYGLNAALGGAAGGAGGAGYGIVGGATEPAASLAMGSGAGGASGGAAMGAAGGAAGAGGVGTMPYLTPLSTSIADVGALPTMSAGSGIGGAAAGLMDKYGGAAATALGALAGSQGQKKEETTSKQMDPRMDPYIYGNKDQRGLLQYAQSVLDRQMSPGYLQGYEDMRNVGRGLLGQPVAGNGFNKFFPGR